MIIDINAAPEDTPMIPGSANGLRMTACKSTPDTARAAPANNEMIILGKRRSFIICTFSFVSVNSPFINSIADTSILPVTAEYIVVTRSRMIAIIKLITFLFIFIPLCYGHSLLMFIFPYCYLTKIILDKASQLILLMLQLPLNSQLFQNVFLLNHRHDHFQLL